MGHNRNALQIWMINLDNAEERYTRMSEQLNAMGLSFNRFAAIDGKTQAGNLKAQVDKPFYERYMGQQILPGKIGCYFSHLAVWKKLVESGAPIGLILEDDVVFHEDFGTALDLALAGSEHWDLLKLNSTRAKFPIGQGKMGEYRLNAYLGRFTGNGCYLLKRETAVRLIPDLEEMKLAFEHEIGRYFAHNYRQYGLQPFPTHIDDGGVSQITGVGNEFVSKTRGLGRLPFFLFKAANYLRRLNFLVWRGRIVGRSTQLLEYEPER